MHGASHSLLQDEELQPVGTFDGPSTWEEVDTLDLERVMVRVTSAAMPSTDNKEMASRLAMQASYTGITASRALRISPFIRISISICRPLPTS